MTTLAEAVASRPVVLDGGLATHLESGGADLSGGLWSARMLLDPAGRERLVQAHADFLAAGAEVLTTASYQLGARSLERAGLDPSTAGDLAARSVAVAREAAAALGEGRTAWVAGSVGAYGALLADGSEYTGDYDLGDEAATVRALVDAHAPRVEALLRGRRRRRRGRDRPAGGRGGGGGPRARARPERPAWVSLTVAPGGTTTRRGEPLADAVAPLAGLADLVAVGVNCVRPQDVAPALSVLSALGVPLVAYPNSGETWDAAAQRWTGRGRLGRRRRPRLARRRGPAGGWLLPGRPRAGPGGEGGHVGAPVKLPAGKVGRGAGRP